jgi:hypothetical protein
LPRGNRRFHPDEPFLSHGPVLALRRRYEHRTCARVDAHPRNVTDWTSAPFQG